MSRFFVLLVLCTVGAGCGPSWPSTCEVVRLAPTSARVVQCKCPLYRIRVDRPQKRVDQFCGQEPMPIVVHGEVEE